MFMWSHLLIELLLQLPQSTNTMKEMLHECKLTCKDNSSQLKLIEEFDADLYA
jgi:hypothetical protein